MNIIIYIHKQLDNLIIVILISRIFFLNNEFNNFNWYYEFIFLNKYTLLLYVIQ